MNTTFLSNSLKTLKLKGASSIAEITNAYLNITGNQKFSKIFFLNEQAKEEYIKYHEAYVLAVREFSTESSEAVQVYYPQEDLFNILFNQGVYHFLKENYLKAGEKFEEAVRMDKEDSLSRIYLGLILKKRKNYYAAERYFLKSIELDRENEYAWFFLGQTYLKAKKLNKASSAFRKTETLSFYNNEIIAMTKDAFIEIERIRMKMGKKSILTRVFKK